MLLPVPPTKASLLALRRQLAFAQEGYDLLEQKRQILVVELMSRLAPARRVGKTIDDTLRGAFDALRAALLDTGSDAIDRAALAAADAPQVHLSPRRVAGIRSPEARVGPMPRANPLGPSGTSAHADAAMLQFRRVLPLLAELAAIQTFLHRIACELRKTQRRCNALSRIYIPDRRETLGYIATLLEERERETLAVLKMLRDRVTQDS